MRSDSTPIYHQEKILADYLISESTKRRFCIPSYFHSTLNETALFDHGLSELQPSAVGWWVRFDCMAWDNAEHTFRLGLTLLEGTTLKQTSLLMTKKQIRGGRLVNLPSARVVYEADVAHRGGALIKGGAPYKTKKSACSRAVGGPIGLINVHAVWPDEL